MADERSRQRPSSPKPWRQFETRTTFLRVPADDWAAVKIGSKTEFRAAGHSVTQLWNVACPTPVVGWTARRNERYESVMLVLEATWQEMVGSITPESLQREGFPSMAHFRRYWMSRTKRRFRPLQKVQVYRVRPMTTEDEVSMGLQLFRKLYSEHLLSGPR
jgi:hypothetical protein